MSFAEWSMSNWLPAFGAFLLAMLASWVTASLVIAMAKRWGRFPAATLGLVAWPPALAGAWGFCAWVMRVLGFVMPVPGEQLDFAFPWIAVAAWLAIPVILAAIILVSKELQAAPPALRGN